MQSSLPKTGTVVAELLGMIENQIGVRRASVCVYQNSTHMNLQKLLYFRLGEMVRSLFAACSIATSHEPVEALKHTRFVVRNAFALQMSAEASVNFQGWNLTWLARLLHYCQDFHEEVPKHRKYELILAPPDRLPQGNIKLALTCGQHDSQSVIPPAAAAHFPMNELVRPLLPSFDRHCLAQHRSRPNTPSFAGLNAAEHANLPSSSPWHVRGLDNYARGPQNVL